MNPRLTPELVLSAYCQGCFPMADPETGEISFYEPDPRALIPLDERFHIPHGLKRVLNKKPFELRMDTAFPDVVHACARTDEPEEQWIDGQIEEVYGRLHEMGFAHSVECWDEEGLQGGLYGVSLGKHVSPENGRQQDCPGSPGSVPAGPPVPFSGYAVDYAAFAEVRNVRGSGGGIPEAAEEGAGGMRRKFGVYLF